MRLTLFALALLASPLLAAPVPPAKPAELTREQMVGQWAYEYGSLTDGTLHLFPDGSYVSWHTPAANVPYHGYWFVSGNTLHLREWSGSGGGSATDYAVTFTPGGWPFLCGQTGSGVRVELRR